MKYPPLTVGAEPYDLPADYLLNPANGPVDSHWDEYPDLKTAAIQAVESLNTCDGWRTYVESVALVLRRFGRHDDIRPGTLLWVGVSDLGAIVKVQKMMGKTGYSLKPWHGEQRPGHMTFMLTKLQPTDLTTRTGGGRTSGTLAPHGQGQDGGQP